MHKNPFIERRRRMTPDKRWNRRSVEVDWVTRYKHIMKHGGRQVQVLPFEEQLLELMKENS